MEGGSSAGEAIVAVIGQGSDEDWDDDKWDKET